MTTWRIALRNTLVVAAASVLLIEFGEFAMLAYVWGFATAAKVTSVLDESVILGTTLLTLSGTLSLTAASLMTIHCQRVWPTFRSFSVIAGIVVATQVFFLLLGTVNFEGDWLNDFFRSKSPTFAAGLVSALVLAAASLAIRPPGASPKDNELSRPAAPQPQSDSPKSFLR